VPVSLEARVEHDAFYDPDFVAQAGELCHFVELVLALVLEQTAQVD
jgi:hypothetical protein